MNKDRAAPQINNQRDQYHTIIHMASPPTQRERFLSHLTDAIEQLDNYQHGFVVFFIKVDNYHEVEQSFGFELSEQLLTIIGSQLSNIIAANDCLVSLQGDEFAILKTDISTQAQAMNFAVSIQELFRLSFCVDRYRILCSSSIGISLQTESPRTVVQILYDADAALKLAQQQGKGKCHLSTVPPPPAKNNQLMAQQDKLISAIFNGDILPYYQPIIHLNNNELIGFEVVARWQEDKNLTHNALNFIPQAERTDVIIALDLDIVNQACRQLKSWHNSTSNNAQIMLSINLSAKHLILDGAIEQLLLIIQRYQLPPQSLVFEFREQDFNAQNDFALQSLHKLREFGVQVGLDNFGTGFSSLNAFFDYPIDFVKIDQSFTRRMLQSKKDISLIRAIRDISHDMGLQVIAEGIENSQQHAKLVELGCEFGQGNYIGKPMSCSQVNRLLDM